jgi:hypothetical protein
MERPDTVTRVVVVDVDMPFGTMVQLLIKLAFAAIPAYLLVMATVLVLIAIAGALGATVNWIF